MFRNQIEVIKLNIKTVFANRTILILIMLSQIISAVALLYTYAMTFTVVNIDMEAGVFTISYDEGRRLGDIDVHITDFAEKNGCDAAVFYLDESKTLSASKYGAKYAYPLAGKSIDTAGDENQLLAGKNSDLKINDIVEILGKSYRVVGTGFSEESEINYTSLSEDTEVYSVEITNTALRSKRAKQRYVQSMENAFGRPVITNEIKGVVQLTENIIFLPMSAIILSAFASLLLGYKYINDRRKENFRIFALLGQTRLQSYFTLFLELVFFCFICFAAGSVIYSVLDTTLLFKLSVSYALFQLSPADYAVTGLIYTLCVSTLLTSSTSLKSTKRRSPFALH